MTGWLIIAAAAVGWALVSCAIGVLVGRAIAMFSRDPLERRIASPLVQLDLDAAARRRRRRA